MSVTNPSLSSAAFSIETQLHNASRTLGLPLLVLDPRGTPLAKDEHFPPEVLRLLQRHRQALLQQDADYFSTLTMLPLAQEHDSYGWLIIPTAPASISTQQRDLLAPFLRSITFLLWHKKEIDAIERRHREQFLYDLLYHNFASSNEMVALGRLWNYHLDRPHYIMVMEFDRELPVEQQESYIAILEKEVIRYLSRHVPQPISFILGEQLVLLLEESNLRQSNLRDMATGFQNEMQTRAPFLPTYSIGIGRLHHAPSDLCRSFQEARQAVSLGRYRCPTAGITSYADLSVLKLLSHIPTEELDDFCQEALGVLIAYDEENDADYLHTLEVFFEENESLPAAANRLFIHVNTLRNRIRKIGELLHTDLTLTDHRVRFYVACQALRVLRRINR